MEIGAMLLFFCCILKNRYASILIWGIKFFTKEYLKLRGNTNGKFKRKTL